ncbi:MAG: hypothetical protein O7H41_18335 [Planctomycetota bacterium]|nr:hypothetical protein [Planctomycetota bacterium]
MLLSMVILGFWVALTVSPLIHPTEVWIYFPETEWSWLVPRDVLGFPLIFIETKWNSQPRGVLSEGGPEFYLGRFLADFALAFTAVYTLPMALDRLVFPMLRAKRRRKRGPIESN